MTRRETRPAPVLKNDRENGRFTEIRRFIRQRLQRHDSVSVSATTTSPADRALCDLRVAMLMSVPVWTIPPSDRSSLTKPRGSRLRGASSTVTCTWLGDECPCCDKLISTLSDVFQVIGKKDSPISNAAAAELRPDLPQYSPFSFSRSSGARRGTSATNWHAQLYSACGMWYREFEGHAGAA